MVSKFHSNNIYITKPKLSLKRFIQLQPLPLTLKEKANPKVIFVTVSRELFDKRHAYPFIDKAYVYEETRLVYIKSWFHVIHKLQLKILSG